MMLNHLGNIANDFWIRIPKHEPQVELHAHVVMPNHMHGVIEMIRTSDGCSYDDDEDGILDMPKLLSWRGG